MRETPSRTASGSIGDFNGDGFADLAIGVPGDVVGGKDEAGAVNVIYGGAAGLTATGNQLWTQDSTDVLDAAEAGDSFGSALAAADLNGDGQDDQAIGVPGESVGTSAGPSTAIDNPSTAMPVFTIHGCAAPCRPSSLT